MSYYKPVTTIASVGTTTTPINTFINSPTPPTTKPNGGDLVQGDRWYDSLNTDEYTWIVTNGVGAWVKTVK